MIYLQIEIRRDSLLDFFRHETGLAELMFRSDDMEESTRRATAILRRAGWKTDTVVTAEEGYSFDDFHADYRLQCLFYEAREKGVACAITTPATEPDEVETTWQSAAALRP